VIVTGVQRAKPFAGAWGVPTLLLPSAAGGMIRVAE